MYFSLAAFSLKKCLGFLCLFVYFFIIFYFLSKSYKHPEEQKGKKYNYMQNL